MANVSRANENRLSNELATVKKESSDRTVEEKKRHQEQVADLRRQQADEIRRLKENFNKAFEIHRTKSQEAMTKRDVDHRNEVAELKKLHQSQMRGLNSDFESKINRLTRAKKQNEESLTKRNQIQIENFKRLKEGQLQQKEMQLQDYIDKSRKAQQNALNNQRRELQTYHNREKDELQRNRDDKVGKVTTDYEKFRHDKNTEVKRLRANSIRDKFLASEKQKEQRLRDTNNFQNVVNTQRKEFQRNLEQTREEYGQNLTAETRRMEQAHQNLKDTVDRRIETDLAVREREIRRLNDEKARERKEIIRLSKAERNALMKNAQERIEDLEFQKSGLSDSLKEENNRNLSKFKKSAQNQLHSQVKHFKEKIDKIKSEEVGGLREQVEMAEIDKLAIRQNSELRLKKAANNFQRDMTDLRDFYEKRIGDIKNSHENQLIETRRVGREERQELTKRMNKQIKQVQLEFEDKIAVLQDSHARELKDLQAKSDIEYRDLTKKMQREIDSRDRGAKLQTDILLAQNKERIDNMAENHQRQIEEMKRRFEAEKIEIARRKF